LRRPLIARQHVAEGLERAVDVGDRRVGEHQVGLLQQDPRDRGARCCWPPESVEARCAACSASPTRCRQAIAPLLDLGEGAEIAAPGGNLAEQADQ
jgi:hypothetical protein